MFKLFNKFLAKRLLPSYLRQTILDFRPNSFSEFKLQQRLVLNFFSILLIFLLCITQLSCNTTEPTPPPPDDKKPTLTLAIDDTSCTEVWLQLQTKDLPLPAALTLKQYNPSGDSLSKIFILNTQDSLLYIDSLLPNQTYNYQAVLSTDTTIKSEKVTAQTLEPTSHNFTWQVFTFGEYSHSVLRDVAIIDENNIWAVGEIYMNDSLGNPDPKAYNAVHWNGSVWELKRIYFPTVCGSTNRTPYPAKSIFAFQEGEIWIGSGGDKIAILENGIQVEEFCLPSSLEMGINKLWGTSSNSIYFVGNNGNIVHLTRTQFLNTWTKIESGTNVNLLDIWGSDNGNALWTCGYTNDYGTSSLIRINNNISETIFEGLSNSQNNGYYIGPISGVWSDNDHRVFLMNWSGIYLQKNNNQFFLEKEIAKISDVGFGIDGTGYNNVFACGEGFVGHWNGYSYTEYPELFHQQRAFKSVKANTNIVCAVGLDYNSPIYSNAVIVLGK